MAVRYFYDVPVYRLPEERYYAEREAHLKRELEWAGIEKDKNLALEDHILDRYGGPWTFNEIVGYIRLHFLGSQIRGEWFSTRAKKIVRTRKKVMWMLVHKLAPEVDIPHGATSAEIFAVMAARMAMAAASMVPTRTVSRSEPVSMACAASARAHLHAVAGGGRTLGELQNAGKDGDPGGEHHAEANRQAQCDRIERFAEVILRDEVGHDVVPRGLGGRVRDLLLHSGFPRPLTVSQSVERDYLGTPAEDITTERIIDYKEYMSINIRANY